MIEETNSSFEQNQHDGDARVPHSGGGAANTNIGGDVGCAAVEVRRCAPKEVNEQNKKSRRGVSQGHWRRPYALEEDCLAARVVCLRYERRKKTQLTLTKFPIIQIRFVSNKQSTNNTHSPRIEGWRVYLYFDSCGTKERQQSRRKTKIDLA